MPSGHPTIRPYQPSDRPSVLALLQLNIPQYFHETELADFERYLDHEAAQYYVVETAGEVRGCGGCNLVADGTEGRLSWDFFHPASRGQGMGRQLTEFRLEQLRQQPGVQLLVVRTSQHAWRFYRRFGFCLRQVVADYWAPGQHLYHMQMPAAL